MADDKQPKSGSNNLVPDEQAFNFDAFFDNATANDSGSFPMAEPEPLAEPVVENVGTEEVAEVVEDKIADTADAVDDAPPVDEPSDADKQFFAARRFLDRLWMGVAVAGIVVLTVTNILLVISPPAVLNLTAKIWFFAMFNSLGLVTFVGPLALWRAGAKLDIRKDRDKAQLAIQERSWLPNTALSLALVAVCIGVMVLLVEFYQYDFTLTAK